MQRLAGPFSVIQHRFQYTLYSLYLHSLFEHSRVVFFVFFSTSRLPHSGHFLFTGRFQNTLVQSG